MNKTIWKFPLHVVGINRLQIPDGYEVLTVQSQNNTPCLWILVNPESPKVDCMFETFGAGHSIHYDMGVERKYVGTYQLDGGEFVGHVFERL